MELSTMQPPETGPPGVANQDVLLRGCSYDERRAVLPAVAEAVSAGGCWLKERRVISFSQVEFVFEMQLRAALDVYSALIAAGLDLSQASHAGLTGLCTVHRHNNALRERPNRVLTVRLEVSFLEESEFELGLGGVGAKPFFCVPLR